VLWVCSLTLAGYLFGNVPWVQDNLSLIIWALIIVPGLIVLGGALKVRLKGKPISPVPPPP
jgi:membrane-associated protein